MRDYEDAEAALCQANEMDKWDATTWGYCAVLCAKAGRRLEGEQAVSWAAKLHLRDFTLIQEIISLYDENTQGEEARVAINELKLVKEGDCHKPLEVNSEPSDEACFE